MTPGRHAIDWADVHRRIGEAARVVAGASAGAEGRRRILRERARVLAEVIRKPDFAETWTDVVEFRLANEIYAVETRFVREVRSLPEITPLPGTAAFFAGVVAVRGRIIAVIDGRTLLGLSTEDRAGNPALIVVHAGDAELGILADEVQSLRSLARSEIGPPPFTLAGNRLAFVQGVTRTGGIVLDVDRMLSDPEIVETRGST